MRFRAVQLSNVGKYLSKFALYTYANAVADIVLDKLKCNSNSVVIEIYGISEGVCIFEAICRALKIECKQSHDMLRIEIKKDNREELSKAVIGVFDGFKIIGELEDYGVLDYMDLKVKVCDEVMEFDVEVGK